MPYSTDNRSKTGWHVSTSGEKEYEHALGTKSCCYVQNQKVFHHVSTKLDQGFCHATLREQNQAYVIPLYMIYVVLLVSQSVM